MMIKYITKFLPRFTPLVLAFSMGIFALYLTKQPEEEAVTPKSIDKKQDGVTELKLVSIPKAAYSDIGRAEEIEGSVLLKVTLLADGSVGEIKVIRGLDGLTEKAIEAASKIKFEPKLVNGQPVTVVKTFEYTFSID